MGRSVKGIVQGAGAVLAAVMITLSSPAAGHSEERGLIVEGPDRSLRVDPAVLDSDVRSVLGIPNGDRLVYEGRPNTFSYPDPDGLEGRVMVEGKDRDRRTFHMGLVVTRGPVMVETFYFDVSVESRKTSVPGISRMSHGVGVEQGGAGGVQSGDTVRIRAIGHGFVITLAGIAQESGRTGDRITVFNPMSGVRLQGLVTGPDRVRIRMEDEKNAID
jgi:flagella basal body P-ring formation protein FlgA